MKPVIGIVARPTLDCEKYTCTEIYDYERICLIKEGALPIAILPPQNLLYYNERPRNTARLTQEEKQLLIDSISMCDGILLQGGNSWYEYDEFITEYCITNDIPLLGTCLGMQLMAYIYSKNHNRSDFKTRKIENNSYHFLPDDKNVHEVYLDKNSRLYSIFNTDKIVVNSSHNYQAVDNNKEIIKGNAPDGVIEYIEIPNVSYALGVQWHPERLYVDDEYSKLLIKDFVNTSKEYNKNRR